MKFRMLASDVSSADLLGSNTMEPQRYQSCIEACNTCADACDYCSIACLQEDDVKMMADCIRLNLDCAAICRLAVAYMAREYVGNVCNVCADSCEACGVECARHPQAYCQICAQACRRCAEECRRLSSAAAAKPRCEGRAVR